MNKKKCTGAPMTSAFFVKSIKYYDASFNIWMFFYRQIYRY